MHPLLARTKARVREVAKPLGEAAVGNLTIGMLRATRYFDPIKTADMFGRITRLIGPAHASEICFTGRMVAADEALAIGLVNRVSEPDGLLDDVLALAEAIVANSPGGVQLSKRALQANMEISSYAAALELENRGQALLTRSADMPEALAAFKEKRPAVFTGA